MKKLIIFILICFSIYGYFKRNEYIPLAQEAIQTYIPENIRVTLANTTGQVYAANVYLYVYIDEVRNAINSHVSNSAEALVTSAGVEPAPQESFSLINDYKYEILDSSLSATEKALAFVLLIANLVLANMVTLLVTLLLLGYLIYRVLKSIYFPDGKRRLIFSEDE